MHRLPDRRRVRLGRPVTRNGKFSFDEATMMRAQLVPRTPAERRAASLTLASIALRLSSTPAADLRAVLDALGLRP